MRVACIDKGAAERIRLQKLVDQAFQSCRDSIGHLAPIELIPLSKEEFLLSRTDSPEKVRQAPVGRSGTFAAIVGWGYSVEECYTTCSELRAEFEKLPIVVILPQEQFSLRILRRFERLSVEVLTTDESAIRIVHCLLRLANERRDKANQGKLLTVVGTKGGVGASSIVGAIAHSAQALGKRALVIDLARESSLALYFQAEKTKSVDYRTLLVDKINPTRSVLTRCIVESPNGINILVPPAGESDIRELWLRNPETFEITLNIIEFLREEFDLLIVDLAKAEGLLPFSILARSDIRLIVSSNDPASVHLLGKQILEFNSYPGIARTIILLNMLQERAISVEDIKDFLLFTDGVQSDSLDLAVISKDACGANWIGTGNTFFTESSKTLQNQFNNLTRTLFSAERSQSEIAEDTENNIGRFRKAINWWKKKGVAYKTLSLPAPPNNSAELNPAFVKSAPVREIAFANKPLSQVALSQKSEELNDLFEGYEPPKVRILQK